MPPRNEMESATNIVIPANILTEKVAERQFTVDRNLLSGDSRSKLENLSSKERREFWARQWSRMHRPTHNSLQDGEEESLSKRFCRYGLGRRIPEKWKDQIEKGMTPMDIWEAEVEEMDKNGNTKIYGHEIFKNEEIKNQWKLSKEAGETEKFWYQYWEDIQTERHRVGRRFGHPKEFQEKWQSLKTEGKSPEEIWQEMGRERWKMGRWSRHHHHQSWQCSSWKQNFTTRSRDRDESDIYQQFDF